MTDEHRCESPIGLSQTISRLSIVILHRSPDSFSQGAFVRGPCFETGSYYMVLSVCRYLVPSAEWTVVFRCSVFGLRPCTRTLSQRCAFFGQFVKGRRSPQPDPNPLSDLAVRIPRSLGWGRFEDDSTRNQWASTLVLISDESP